MLHTVYHGSLTFNRATDIHVCLIYLPQFAEKTNLAAIVAYSLTRTTFSNLSFDSIKLIPFLSQTINNKLSYLPWQKPWPVSPSSYCFYFVE